MSTAIAETVSESELERVLRKTLEASDKPLSANQILKELTGPFQRPKKEVEETLEAMADRGKIHRIRKVRGNQLYWDRNAEEFARNLMLEKLSERPRTRSELLQSVKGQLQMLSKNRREEIVRELVRTSAVKELPAFVGGRSKRLSTKPVDSRDYIEQALEKVCKQLTKEGVSEEEVHAAAREFLGTAPATTTATKTPSSSESPVPTPPVSPTPQPPAREVEPQAEPKSDPASTTPGDVKDLVLARVMEIDVGALVPMTQFRQGLDFQDRREVDQAIWDLVRNEVVAIHKHHHPISMSDSEREASLRDDEGNLYHAISRRYR